MLLHPNLKFLCINALPPFSRMSVLNVFCRPRIENLHPLTNQSIYRDTITYHYLDVIKGRVNEDAVVHVPRTALHTNSL